MLPSFLPVYRTIYKVFGEMRDNWTETEISRAGIDKCPYHLPVYRIIYKLFGEMRDRG